MTPRRAILLLLLVVGGAFSIGCEGGSLAARRPSPVIQPTTVQTETPPSAEASDRPVQRLTVLKDRRERTSPVIQPTAERSQ